MAHSYSYSYSETVTGTTNNAAVNGYTWNMYDVLPPQAGLAVNGLIYSYTVEKDPQSDMSVTIQNEYALGEGYIIQHTDDWSQLPGTTINNMLSFGDLSREVIGNGEIVVDGDGSVLDPNVRYTYRYDECYVPISNPKCDGYAQALYDWLKERGLLGKDPEVGDPYYDEWVQLTLDRETEKEEDDQEIETKNEEEENDPIAAMNAEVDIEGFVDGAAQAAVLQALSAVPNIETYYTTNMPGGVYEDVLRLDDKELPDNRRALSNLAQDTLHREMVRSQYNRN